MKILAQNMLPLYVTVEQCPLPPFRQSRKKFLSYIWVNKVPGIKDAEH